MIRGWPGVIERVLTIIGTLALFALMLIVFVDVVGRNLFDHPLLWGTEIMEILLALMVFAFYPILARRHGHIVVDLVPVHPALRSFQRMLSGGVGAVVFGVIAWTCGRQALRSAEYGDATALLSIPTAWVLWVMAVLAAMSAVIFFVHATGPRMQIAVFDGEHHV